MNKDSLFWNENSDEIKASEQKEIPDATDGLENNGNLTDKVEDDNEKTAVEAVEKNIVENCEESSEESLEKTSEEIRADVNSTEDTESAEIPAPVATADGRAAESTIDYSYVPLVEEYNVKAARARFNLIGFGLSIFTVVTFIVSLILQYIALFAEMLTGVEIISSNLFLNAVTPVSLYLFALPVLLVFFAIFKVRGEAPKKSKLGFGMWCVVLVVCFGLMYIGSYMGQFTMWGISCIVGYDYSNMLNDMIDYNGMWITVIFMCIVAPIGEEFVFRKLIIDRTHKYGGTISIFLSALAFGLMHANFYQFFYAFFVGLVFGYVYYKTGKLWHTIALHMTVNFVGSVLTSYMQLGVDNMMAALESIGLEDTVGMLVVYAQYAWVLIVENMFLAFVFAAMLCAIVIPIVLRKKIVLERGDKPIPVGRSFGAGFLNPGVIILLIVYVLEFSQMLVLLPLSEWLTAITQQMG